MDRRLWLSPRALRLHAVLLVVIPAFLAMGAWQLSRALAGNELSWAYVFEWPLFAAYAIYMWWRLLHESTEEDPTPDERVDAELAAYNDYLAQLAERDRAAGR